jgi:hypothetical protein
MDFTREELQEYVEFMLNQLRKADGFWFIGVEKTFGYDAAIKINEEVWHKMGRLMTREIKERFSIHEKGLAGFAKVLRYSPWATISGFHIEATEREVLVAVAHCRSQEARIKKGVGEYDCRDMHFGEFRSITEEVDENINIECLFAPPDPHPPGTFCTWRFTMKSRG